MQLSTQSRVFRKPVAIAALLLVTTVSSFSQDYAGSLPLTLFAQREPYHSIQLQPLSSAAAQKLNVGVPDDAKLFSGTIHTMLRGHSALKVVIVEAGSPPVLYFDLNGDGVFSPDERFQFNTSNLQVDIPLASGSVRSYPLVLRYAFQPLHRATRNRPRSIKYSVHAFAQGHAAIGNRNVLIRVDYNPVSGVIDPLHGQVGMDLDKDGRIDDRPFSPEIEVAEGSAAVFHVGGYYISINAVDRNSGAVSLRAHPATDYNRIDLHSGDRFPEFSFIDFSGLHRNLSEFKGKYLLLDFWISSSSLCVADVATLKNTYDRYYRHLQILGLNGDEDIRKPTAVASFYRAVWPQAQLPTIKQLLVPLRVRTWPVKILLDKDLRVVSLDQDELTGERLDETLQRLVKQKQ